MSRTGLETLHDGLPDMLRRMAAVAQRDVLVGIPAGEQRDDGPTNAEIGYQNEFGSPANNIPARPHLIPGVAAVQDKAVARLTQAASAAATGRMSDAERHLHAAGLIAQSSVRRTLTTAAYRPLSERTLAERRARGRTGTKPLIDTGQYRNSITYVVRDGKS